MPSLRRGMASVSVAVLTAACSHAARLPPVTVPPVDQGRAAVRLFLLGDAGAPALDEPVLRALREDVRLSPHQSVVVFLGDNVYPAGFPGPASADRMEAERRLLAQIEAVTGAGGRVIFVPGNHDWHQGAADGFERIRAQGRFIQEHGERRAALVPPDGCPGPVVEEIHPILRVVVLDTQWWLRGEPRFGNGEGVCVGANRGTVTEGLRAVLRSRDEGVTVVVGHHPIVSGGRHGGHYSLLDHVFPLRALNRSLWIPLPVIGSLYPFARQNGISSQDLSSRKYGDLVDSLRAAFRAAPPLLYASGHEHALQVFQLDDRLFSVVSGSGYLAPGRLVHWVAGMRFGSAEAGYMRLDVLPDGRARLAVREVDDAGQGREAYSTWLR